MKILSKIWPWSEINKWKKLHDFKMKLSINNGKENQRLREENDWYYKKTTELHEDVLWYDNEVNKLKEENEQLKKEYNRLREKDLAETVRYTILGEEEENSKLKQELKPKKTPMFPRCPKWD